jgi:hypothetical protein
MKSKALPFISCGRILSLLDRKAIASATARVASLVS